MVSLLPRFSLPLALARCLPGSSALFGPPRRWATVEEYAEHPGFETWIAEPEEGVAAPRARIFGEVDPAFQRLPPRTIHSKIVFRTHEASIYGPDGHVITRDDTFLWDTAWHLGRDPAKTFRGRNPYRRRRPRQRRRLEGRTATLASDWAIGGFGHFMTDALPRWRLLQNLGHAAPDFDHIVLFHPETPSTRRLVEAAGIPSARLVPYDPNFDLQCDELTGTTFPGAVPAASAHSMAWLRRLGRGGTGVERVYLSRAGYRRHPANAADIEQELSKRKFRTVHGDDGTTAPDACASARVIIGVEGAHLFNLCMAPPGTRVVLLLPGIGLLPYLPYLCQAAGFELAIVAASAGSPLNAPEFPISSVVAALDWAESEPVA
jgi:capsular polysaccharide biosynthesis protein